MRKYFVLIICVISLFLLPEGLDACALTTYGFETTDLSEESKNQIWENIEFKKSVDSMSLDSIRLPIVSFDVSKNGMILLGLEGNKVAIVDESKVLAFFEFSINGSFYVQWHDNNILLLLVRGSIIVEISTNGQLINMIKADTRSTQNNTLWNQIDRKKQVDIGESSYCVKNNMGILNFFLSTSSLLIKSDSTGSEKVIYDVRGVQSSKTITILIIVIALFAVVVFELVRLCRTQSCGHIEGMTTYEDKYVEISDNEMLIPTEVRTKDKRNVVDIYIERVDDERKVVDSELIGEAEKDKGES